MTWNPILVRETRARFRHGAAFALLFGYAALLAGAMGVRYGISAHDYAHTRNPLFRISGLGHELFLALIWMQSLAWLLIAPAITASSIAREREDGLLEGVLLSPLLPRHIVNGKLLSAGSFIALILLISLPIEAVCFLMGGVSPQEFFAAFSIHATSAATGAMIGLMCSARARRAGIALRSAYILMGVWLIGSLLSFWALAVGPALGYTLGTLEQVFLGWFAWSNPILATYSIASSDATKGFAPASATGVFSDAPWTISLLFQWILCAVLYRASTLAVRRPLDAADEGTQNRWQAPAAFQGRATRAPSTPVTEKTADLDWMEIPLAGKFRFSNPVLQREARGKFRMRRPPLWVALFEGLLALAVAYGYLLALYNAVFEPQKRETIWWVICFIGLLVVVLSSAVMGASSFAREREGQTWDALRLSLLSPAQIVRAKLGAILLALAVYSLPFWPLLLPCVQSTWSYPRYGGNHQGLSLAQALITFFIFVSTAFCYTLWGMLLSWKNRRSVAAIGWTLGSLFFILVFAPVFLAVAFSHGNNDAMWFFHPFVNLGFVTDSENLAQAFGCAVFLLAAGVLWWRVLLRAVEDEGETGSGI